MSSSSSKPRRRAAFGEDLDDLVADALGGDVGQRGRGGHDGGVRVGVDREAEAGREAHRTQHAEPVLRDARAWVADGPDDAGTQVGAPADEVEHLAARRVLEERVDR